MAIAIGGCIWLAVGASLLILGMRFLEASIQPETYTPLLNLLQNFTGSRDNGVILLIILGLIVGQIKGRMIMEKSADREVSRIRTLANPIAITHLYSPRYYILMIVMMALGMSMNLLGVPADIRGTIDVTVGIALFRGAVAYFKMIPSAAVPLKS